MPREPANEILKGLFEIIIKLTEFIFHCNL